MPILHHTRLLTFTHCVVCVCVFFSPSQTSLTKEAVQTTPTIGSNVEEIAVRKTRFLVWDIGGQESLRASWGSYYCNTEVGCALALTGASHCIHTGMRRLHNGFKTMKVTITCNFASSVQIKPLGPDCTLTGMQGFSSKICTTSSIANVICKIPSQNMLYGISRETT